MGRLTLREPFKGYWRQGQAEGLRSRHLKLSNYIIHEAAP